MKKALSVIFSVLLIDQLIKIYVKTHFLMGDEVHIFGNWFIIHFTENNGMAFGMQFAGSYGKIFLSTFRIVAVIGIGWYLVRLIKQKVHGGLIVCFSLIFAGALGNIIDSAFYGMIFSDSNYQMAQLFPKGGGYAPFLHGKVVDMFYFPIMEGHFPAWFPLWGGQEYIFFRPVFNTADASITIGVLLFLLFQKKFYPTSVPETSI